MRNQILPQGDLIRQLLANSNISKAKINLLIREKGVFLGGNEKNNSIPTLMKTIISPNNFSYLYECQKNKEETEKYRNWSIKCDTDFAFSDILSDNINLHSMIKERHTYKPNYELIGTPSFYYKDKDTAILDFNIKRNDLLSNFGKKESYHKGSVILRKNPENKQVSIQLNFTSKETKEVNDILVKVIKDRFYENSIIKSEDDVIVVKFGDFTNHSRVLFFYDFVKDFNYTTFISITDIDIYLDEDSKSPQELELFLKELDNLKLSGKNLQEHILLREQKYYSKLLLCSLKLRYKINYNGIEGYSTISLGFPDYTKNRDIKSEFQISIDLTLDKKHRNTKTEHDIRKKLLELFEIQKVKSYEDKK